jgi:hypothetical protein
MTKPLLTLFTIGLLTFPANTLGAQHPQMPPGMTHEEHLAQMKKDADLKARGAAAMGFEQDAAEHHFLLYEDGGAIEVTAVRGDDAATRTAVRRHLQIIAKDFANGTFDKPFATHAETPAGVMTMQQLRKSLTYQYEETARGGRVRIKTTDPAALAGVHAFLRYQIVEHKTGDSLSPRKR